eukprot:CAMPEP_0183337040 /NCGR_PEP_ID=MMETSP0164_2-20130417/4844_1 /TAXON_ID=221442 /ORGANISM="Coccolithus pelagicus ssp braarudi, Strain PLY182g" /LENGTH=69 /DNA_ID=CAMNT_0025506681 /DNA_START=504 /DNA_END=709 /DNA_ORIENTATION=-
MPAHAPESRITREGVAVDVLGCSGSSSSKNKPDECLLSRSGSAFSPTPVDITAHNEGRAAERGEARPAG